MVYNLIMTDRARPSLKSKHEAVLEKREDEADYRALVKARKANPGKPTYTMAEVKRELGMTRFARKRKA
jgi:hypothetical protein